MPVSRRGVLGGRRAARWEPPLDRSGRISQAPAHNCVPKETVSGPDRQLRCKRTLFFPWTKMRNAPGSFSSRDTALPTTGKRHTVPLPSHKTGRRPPGAPGQTDKSPICTRPTVPLPPHRAIASLHKIYCTFATTSRLVGSAGCARPTRQIANMHKSYCTFATTSSGRQSVHDLLYLRHHIELLGPAGCSPPACRIATLRKTPHPLDSALNLSGRRSPFSQSPS